MSINSGEITMQLSHPLTEEQWDTITDADLEHTNSMWFHTKHGKDVEFAKVVRCKDCRHKQGSACEYSAVWVRPNGFCHWGERSENDCTKLWKMES